MGRKPNTAQDIDKLVQLTLQLVEKNREEAEKQKWPMLIHEWRLLPGRPRRTLFYKLKKKGLIPETYKLGAAIYVTKEADAAWMRKMHELAQLEEAEDAA